MHSLRPWRAKAALKAPCSVATSRCWQRLSGPADLPSAEGAIVLL